MENVVIGDVIIAVIGILSSVALPIGFGMVLGLNAIKFEHKEKMGLIQQGIIPPAKTKGKKSTPNRLVVLRNAFICISIGIGVVVALIVNSLLSYNSYMQEIKILIYPASILLFLGLGFLAYFMTTKNMTQYQISNNDNKDENSYNKDEIQ